ncbi:peptidoglycan pentaglycine glycine transferase (the first glycine) [Natranaerovirga pectinivora]|uniref:Peptidoglycan pentaglycine glycine transferase (The first glycine) n=1 Tax=Natranaerovirga pectinivora TaxID=682400 RepID=A0A4R3MPE5_9FIRM|nr:peptidoglycan bridge formation glycyltransferase FemA/FemB family protein [Natranaerovirga pectinivora]TCT16412.1 peptidoglycan pentaglycine glycine transferase (the first glycine) [Natranaerovirga pectinivora]
MKFVTKIEESKFNRFIESHEIGNELQTIEWGKFKSWYNWSYETVGLVDEHLNLIAGALLLRRKIPGTFKTILYAPRGFVLDYTDEEVLEKFIYHLKSYGKKTKAMFVKIDPCIKHREHNIEGQVIEGGINNTGIIDKLINYGFVYKKGALGFESTQPRFVFELDINRDELDVLKNFHHKTRYNIRLAERKGIEIHQGKKDDLKEFSRIMKVTGDRDGFITRPLSYFEKMHDTLGDKNRMKLFIAKYNINKALDNINEELAAINTTRDNTIEKNEKLILQKNELLELKKNNPNDIIVSGAILLLSGKRACYLYGASDNVYRNLMPNYLLQWEMIKYAMSKGCLIYDFRGVSGDLDPNNPLYGLYKFKKGFNGEFVEYIGEFDLVINKYYYKLWEFCLPKLKSVSHKLKK